MTCPFERRQRKHQEELVEDYLARCNGTPEPLNTNKSERDRSMKDMETSKNFRRLCQNVFSDCSRLCGHQENVRAAAILAKGIVIAAELIARSLNNSYKILPDDEENIPTDRSE